MTKFLRRMLTNDAVRERFNGRFEGRIAAVLADNVFNKWTLKTENVPVIEFEDGWRWIPNIRARRDLTGAWGAETDTWVGRRIAITIAVVTRKEHASGRNKETFEKRVEPLQADILRVPRAQAGEPR